MTTRPETVYLGASAGIFVPERIEAPEMLDLGQGTTADVQQNLAEMWRINRWLGGFRALTRHLYPRLLAAGSSAGQPVTLVDLGTGAAEVPAALVRWSEVRGLPISVLGIDWMARHLAVATRHPAVFLLQADALRLPLPAQSVDYVISSLFLHHFPPNEVIALLRSAFDCARCGIIMSDLVRGWLPWSAFKLVQPIFARNYLTRHDGALSVRRAYTPAELRELADAAGLQRAEIYTHWPWRMTLVADK